MTISRRMVYLEQLFAQGLTKPDIDDTSTAANVVWSATKVSTELGLKASLNSSVSFTALTVNGRDVLAELDAQASRVYAVADISGLQGALNLKLDASKVGAINGVASLDGTGKIPSAQLPAFVDDVIEATNFAALPATGESGKIYVTLDNNKTYRWGGSAYAEISASPGSTDAVPEGATNKYFTDARVRSALLTGLADTAGTLAATDSVLVAFGKVKQTLGAKADLAGATYTGKVTAKAADAAGAYLNAGYGVSPGANAVNGDFWITSTGFFAKYNGVSQQLVGAATLSSYQLTSEKGAVNGYASLDAGGKVPASQLPAVTATTPNSVTFQATGGAASGSTFNGSAALTVSYTTIGAAAAGHDHAGVYQLADATLTALAAVNWTAGTQVLALTGADTFTLKTVGTAAGNLLDKAAGDALYATVGHTHAYIPTAEKGAANGVATLNASGQIPSNQLPSFVDDVLEYANLASFPGTGETGKIYIAADTGMSYRWTGSLYAEIKAGGGTVTWGNITGTLANQTDLTTALNGKLSTGGGTLTGALTINANLNMADAAINSIVWGANGRMSMNATQAQIRHDRLSLYSGDGLTEYARLTSAGLELKTGTLTVSGPLSVSGGLTIPVSGSSISWDDGTAYGGIYMSGGGAAYKSSTHYFRSVDNLTTYGYMGASGLVVSAGGITAPSATISGSVVSGPTSVIRGSAGEGGQLVLGYGGGTATTIIAQGANTWNMDVDGANTLRFFRADATNVVKHAMSIDPTSCVVNFPAGIQTNGPANAMLLKYTGTVPTVIHRVDTSNYYILLSAAGANPDSAYNALRPLFINLTTGVLASSSGQTFSGGTTVNTTLTVNGDTVNSGNVQTATLKVTGQFGFTVGDDAVMGDTNVANCVGLKGQQDANQGFVRFGASATNFGWNGSHLVFGSVMTLGTSGNMSVTGTFTAGGTISASSDERLKENVRTVEGALDKVAQMRGVHFDWIEGGEASSGVIAQEHQKVAPEAVHEDEKGFLTVNDAATTAYLIEAIKELKGIVEAQAAEIAELKAR